VGISLSIYLTLDVQIGVDDEPICQLSYEGEGADEVPRDPEQNLITRTALYVLKCHNITAIPLGTRIHMNNGIPLGRGLGSSGAAVVAGVMLGDMLGGLGLSKERMMDYCLMIERHPDNVMAAMMGGFVGSFLNELGAEDTERKEIPLSEVLPEPAGGIDTGLRPPEPPMHIGHHITFGWARELRAIAIIPQFEVSTAKAREVLPTQYSRSDLVFNLQRLAVLTTALARSPPNPELIHQAMQDRVHQPYRKTLIPGLPEVLASVTPKTHPGLCGICLSGAGPTILALATSDFEHIADTIMTKFKAENITCTYQVLEPAYDGATATFKAA
jgi:homoserine kinase